MSVIMAGRVIQFSSRLTLIWACVPVHAGLFLEWHMRRQLALLPYQEDDPEEAARRQSSPMAKSVVSTRAGMKFRIHLMEEGLPAHGFRTLLADLRTMTLNLVRPQGSTETVPIVTSPTVIQERAFELHGVVMD